MPASVSWLVVLLGGALAFALFSLCLDIVEEHSAVAKRCLRWGITVVLAIHVLLVIDCPVVCVAASALTHASYLRLTKTYPFISSMSLPFCASAGLMIISQVLWMRHFHHTEHSLEYILCFFTTTVWAVPFAIFISMTAVDNTLPSRAAPPSAGKSGVSDNKVDIAAVGGLYTAGSLAPRVRRTESMEA